MKVIRIKQLLKYEFSNSNECSRVRVSATCRLLLTTRDEQSGIESISCTVHDVTLDYDVWTTTEASQRLPRAQTDHSGPDNPERPELPPEGAEEPARVKRVTMQTDVRDLLTCSIMLMRPTVRTHFWKMWLLEAFWGKTWEPDILTGSQLLPQKPYRKPFCENASRLRCLVHVYRYCFVI